MLLFAIIFSKSVMLLAQTDEQKAPAIFETLIFPLQPQHTHGSSIRKPTKRRHGRRMVPGQWRTHFRRCENNGRAFEKRFETMVSAFYHG